MNYIVLDMEWNCPRTDAETVRTPFFFDSEIIQFGAVKLDEQFHVIDEFKCNVKPVFYPTLSGSIARLTRIGQSFLDTAQPFAAAYEAFCAWCGDSYSFMTWSTTDVPVLMDNLLIHGLDLDSIPACYDIQRIFGHEMMRDDRQWALDKVMDMLHLQADKAHNALHDARNTVLVCEYLDLPTYLEEYRLRYVNYAADRLNGLREGWEFDSVAAAFDCEELTSFECPYTGQWLTAGEWVNDGDKIYGYARSSEGDEYCVVLKRKRGAQQKIFLKRLIYEMSDDLWDRYQGLVESQV